VSKGSEAVNRCRQSKLTAGWVRIDGLLPPESAQAARAMVEAGVATSLIHAAAVALSGRNEMERVISVMHSIMTPEQARQIYPGVLMTDGKEISWLARFD